MKTINKIISIFLLALAPYIAQAQMKTSLTQSDIIFEKTPLTRTEVLMKDMPANTDAYIVFEHQGEGNFYKLRAQALPLSYSLLSAGGAVQHVNGGVPREEIGAVLRAKGNIANKLFAKADFQYYPKRNVIESYEFLDGKIAGIDMFADNLGSYDSKNGSFSLRTGADYKASDKFWIGIEGKTNSNNGKATLDYIGARVSVHLN